MCHEFSPDWRIVKVLAGPHDARRGAVLVVHGLHGNGHASGDFGVCTHRRASPEAMHFWTRVFLAHGPQGRAGKCFNPWAGWQAFMQKTAFYTLPMVTSGLGGGACVRSLHIQLNGLLYLRFANPASANRESRLRTQVGSDRWVSADISFGTIPKILAFL